jgi:hypothetical protein
MRSNIYYNKREGKTGIPHCLHKSDTLATHKDAVLRYRRKKIIKYKNDITIGLLAGNKQQIRNK